MNVENKDSLWIFQTPEKIVLEWSELPFETKTSVNWRGLIIHFRVQANKTPFGWTRLVSIRYQEQLYQCKLTKYKWSGGSNGIYPPKISTEDNNLIIKTGGYFILLEDESKEKREILKTPFEIIITPEDITFD